jgi:hypothetical protein
VTDVIYLFDASLVAFPEVWRRVAVRADQTLHDLHEGMRDAFGWSDDHLYSFWLSGEFWAQDGTDYTSPVELEEGQRGADVPIAGLELEEGDRIAYVFDFGDEWRVEIVVAGSEPASLASYPAVVGSEGEAPPQYPDVDEE